LIIAYAKWTTVMNLDTHPTIIAYKEEKEAHRAEIQELEANRLKKDALTAGAAAAGLIDITRASMAAYREDLLKVMPVGFPMEAKNWPGKMWLSNDKIFAIKAGLGHMGWNRLVLHRELGAAVILGSVLTWTRFLAKEAGILPALLACKFKLKGSPKLMGAFAKCFPA